MILSFICRLNSDDFYTGVSPIQADASTAHKSRIYLSGQHGSAMPTDNRKDTIDRILDAFGISSTNWTTIDEIVANKAWLLQNLPEIEASLPKYLIGNLSHLSQAETNRTLISFLRRICQHIEAALLTKRLGQKRAKGRCHNIYAYKVVKHC